VERQSRSFSTTNIPAITGKATWREQNRLFSLLAAPAVVFITAGNGREFEFHHRLGDTMGVPTYFVTRDHPSSGEETNTSTAASGATCPRAPVLMRSPRKNLMSM